MVRVRVRVRIGTRRRRAMRGLRSAIMRRWWGFLMAETGGTRVKFRT